MNSNKTRVTLEDLLRVKRAEQPPSPFWADFEREMRAKQLAAIVEPRPWWAPFIRISSRVSHYHVPLGAAAILALSLVSVTEYRAIALRSVPHQQQIVASVAAEGNEADAAVGALAQNADRFSSQDSDYVVVQDQITVGQMPSSLGETSHTSPLSEPARIELEPSPSARYIAANLAAAQAADPSIMDDVFGPSVRSVEARRPVRDPLTQIASPGESRRSRLMESALPALASNGDVAVGTSDRVARRLTEDRLYDSIRRVGLQGDRVAFKF